MIGHYYKSQTIYMSRFMLSPHRFYDYSTTIKVVEKRSPTRGCR